jgi:branched-chain amino acid transport system substrate-binding protein
MRLLAPGATRARFARRAAAATAALSAAALVLAGCAPAGSGGGTGDTIKIGYIHPATGAYAGFSDGDPYMLSYIREHFADGIEIDGTTFKV